MHEVELTLLAEVIQATVAADKPLTEDEIDDLLGVEAEAAARDEEVG